MEYVFDYLSFFAKALTVIAAVVVIIVAAGARRSHRPPEGSILVVRINDRLRGMRSALQHALTPAARHRKLVREENREQKRERKTTADRARVFVVNFKGDLAASQLDCLRNEITAILTSAREEDEVVVRIESTGGLVHAYGLAASQLARVKEKRIRLVAAIDKVAASGGYMMASVADRIVTAPFAIVGSIGVVAQMPNVHRFLKKRDVDVELLTAGEHKRTLTVFGQNTDSGRAKMQEEIEDIHALFKSFVGEHRPDVDLDAVGTGEAWYGQRAIDRKLVDQLCTSDEYLVAACDDKDVFEVRWIVPEKPMERLMRQLSTSFGRLVERVLERF
ncbi:MAG: protease SohB [Gammaproteobacteria bacterium]|nr:protease SohB [Gammaproteobacteria bacterium]